MNEFIEVLAYHDCPILYSRQDSSGRTFLALMVASEPEKTTWLHAPISAQRLADVRSGAVDLRDAFRGVEGGRLLEVVQTPHGDTMTWLDAADVGDDMLPLPGYRLEDGHG